MDVTTLTYQALRAKLLEMCAAKKLLFSKRYHFFYLKHESRNCVGFACSIKKKAAFCELGDFYVLALALVFTMGINNVSLREKFLEIEKCILEQASR